jgi:type 2 lantibiotic biosynthesis protein LanM
MKEVCRAAPAWYRALTLTERLAAPPARTENGEVNAALAQRRLERWRSQPPFGTGNCFVQRLAAEGLSEPDLIRILGEPVEALTLRLDSPAWLSAIREAFSLPATSSPAPLPDPMPGQESAEFLHAVEPLIRRGRDRLGREVTALAQAHAELPFDPGTVGDTLFTTLPGPLLRMLSRTMVLELHVARLQGQLHGNTSGERFASFLQRLGDRDTALALLEEYPVLARQVATTIDHWVACSLEFLRHLCADWQAIRAAFCPDEDPGVLVEVTGNAGDGHRRGRSVRIARFRSGFQLVYKPRPMSVDVHFQELLAWVNERGDHPPFRTLTILDRGDHGWAEFVVAHGCDSEAAVQRFYERQGGFLALLYALEAIDFHHENLIAAGEHPVLLDLEALFHPRLEKRGRGQADLAADEALDGSVLRVGLLPYRLGASAESEGVDLSGLGTPAGRLTPRPVPQWEGTDTDEMRLTRKRMAMRGSANRPALRGQEVDLLDHAGDIVSGFVCIYRLLLKHRDELLSAAGPLARFAGDEVRVILRPTQTYGRLLQESFHPDVLRNALDRDQLFDRLWATVEHLPHLARVIPAERTDLHEGDIPIFTTRPDSRDLWTSTQGRIPDFFDDPGLALVQRRLRQLGKDDLARQLWFIRASLATLRKGEDRPAEAASRPGAPLTPAGRERLLAGACAVGDRLESLALRGADDISWVGLEMAAGGHLSLAPLATDLYGGLPGVILFLAYLGAVTGEGRYSALARGAVTTLRRLVERRRSSLTGIGAFSGWGGVLYCLTHLGVLWDEPALLREAEAVVEALPPLIERDEGLDIIAGAAGCLGALIGFYRRVPSGRTLAAAVGCGDRLLARAQPMAEGIGWPNPIAGQRPLTGFSHGAAGMAWALVDLAALTGTERFRRAALEAIAYERSLFSPEAGNWPDLRDPPVPGPPPDGRRDRFMTAWCHGAPGIGLARLCSLAHLDDPATRAEIDVAVRTTLSHGLGRNHCLCHGDLGNLELLLLARETLRDPQLGTQLDRGAAGVLGSIQRDGWLCGAGLQVECPGLMNGLAGIGYGLLRLAEPATVPSVLTLAPPR